MDNNRYIADVILILVIIIYGATNASMKTDVYKSVQDKYYAHEDHITDILHNGYTEGIVGNKETDLYYSIKSVVFELFGGE